MNGYILNNNGKGIFSDVTSTVAPELNKIGLITDASWADVDGDSDPDLIVVGEYMPIKVFINEGGHLNIRIGQKQILLRGRLFLATRFRQ